MPHPPGATDSERSAHTSLCCRTPSSIYLNRKSCRITCRRRHHSVTHSLPRAEYPGGCWGPLAIMNYKAGHPRPGRSSHSQTGPQACLHPPAKGSQHLTVIPTPAAFPTATLPSFQNMQLCCSQPWSPIQRLSKGLMCLDGPLFHSTFGPLETSLKSRARWCCWPQQWSKRQTSGSLTFKIQFILIHQILIQGLKWSDQEWHRQNGRVRISKNPLHMSNENCGKNSQYQLFLNSGN